jgi:hypothetical protein
MAFYPPLRETCGSNKTAGGAARLCEPVWPEIWPNNRENIAICREKDGHHAWKCPEIQGFLQNST